MKKLKLSPEINTLMGLIYDRENGLPHYVALSQDASVLKGIEKLDSIPQEIRDSAADLRKMIDEYVGKEKQEDCKTRLDKLLTRALEGVILSRKDCLSPVSSSSAAVSISPAAPIAHSR